MTSLFLNLIMFPLSFAPVVEYNENPGNPVYLTFITTQKPFQCSQLREILELCCVNKKFRETIDAMNISGHMELRNTYLLFNRVKALQAEWQQSSTGSILHKVSENMMRFSKLMLAEKQYTGEYTDIGIHYRHTFKVPESSEVLRFFRHPVAPFMENLRLRDNNLTIHISICDINDVSMRALLNPIRSVTQDISDPTSYRFFGCTQLSIQDVFDQSETLPLQFDNLPEFWTELNSPHGNIPIGIKEYNNGYDIFCKCSALNYPDLICEVHAPHLAGQNDGTISIKYRHTASFFETFYSFISHPRLAEAIKLSCKAPFVCIEMPYESPTYSAEEVIAVIQNTTKPYTTESSKAALTSVECSWCEDPRTYELILRLGL